ncbi:MAG: choice-of-anchor tandem repeat GloVer-containing protein [Candidatus Korobacteraceae bacterium]|jgi:uncharacterized repeat protein (TIGR03803 family)
MAGSKQDATSIFETNLWTGTIALVQMVIFATFIIVAPAAQAQTLTVLHNFTGGGDGNGPYAGITFDQQGRIYGTTAYGGSHQDGVVYRLVHEGEGWVLSPIYSFGSQGRQDGSQPYARVVFGPDGLLYGTTDLGGAYGYGTVFSLQPPATACKAFLCPWLETVIYSFTFDSGVYPGYGDLVFDQAGNIYGTAFNGGSGGGVVFKLTRSGSGWTESVLWNFTGGNDGFLPLGGVIFDNAGNLYGTTSDGGSGDAGTVYELSQRNRDGARRRFIRLPASTTALELAVSSGTRMSTSSGLRVVVLMKATAPPMSSRRRTAVGPSPRCKTSGLRTSRLLLRQPSTHRAISTDHCLTAAAAGSARFSS